MREWRNDGRRLVARMMEGEGDRKSARVALAKKNARHEGREGRPRSGTL